MKRPRAQWEELARRALGGKLGPCPTCGDESAPVLKPIVKVPLVHEEKAYVGSAGSLPHMFFLPIVCANCALVRTFDAEAKYLDLIVNA